MENAVEIQNLGKEYRLYGNPYHRLLESLTLGKKKYHRSLWALRDISIDVPKGSTFGLVGGNGAGKSTLLKILSGTTFPTVGGFRVQGKVASLLELGAGFHKDFSGRANIFMNAAMMGFSRREMERNFQEILEFSGLQDFIDAPLRTYSSGMVCRLGFSVAISVDPDVLILDEILSVGDMEFQKRCVDKIWSFKKQGKTILFCSHSLYDIRQLCDEAAWLKNGRIREIGNAMMVTNDYATYEKQLIGREMDVLSQLPGRPAEEENRPRIDGIRTVDPATGEPLQEVRPGAAVQVVVDFSNPGPPREVSLGVGFTRTDTTLCFAFSTAWEGLKVEKSAGRIVLDIPRLDLLAGEFVVFAWLVDPEEKIRFDQAVQEKNLVVRNVGKEVGLILQDHQWEVEETA